MPADTWVKNFDAELAALAARGKASAIDYGRLYKKCRPPNLKTFEDEIDRRVSRGELLVHFRVVSRETQRKIQDFENRLEVPSTIYDPAVNARISVILNDNLRKICKIPQP